MAYYGRPFIIATIVRPKLHERGLCGRLDGIVDCFSEDLANYMGRIPLVLLCVWQVGWVRSEECTWKFSFRVISRGEKTSYWTDIVGICSSPCANFSYLDPDTEIHIAITY